MLQPVTVFEIALSAVCFVSFGTATRRHFRSDGPVNPGMKVTAAANLGAYALFLDLIGTGGVSLLWPAASVLMAGSLALFFWAIRATSRLPPTLAFEDDVPVMLHRAGPYARIRHPFYTAYLLFWVATALATRDPRFAMVPLAMIGLYVAAALFEERKFAASALADEYRRYRGRAGMFLPRLFAPRLGFE